MISQFSTPILSNRRIAKGHYQLRFKRPSAVRSIRAGQFLQIRLGRTSDPFLPRPLCVYDHGPGWMETVYQVVGRGTKMLSGYEKGREIDVVGPLGNGFPLDVNGQNFVFIAGGVGIASLYLTARNLVRKKGRKKDTRFILLFGSQSKKTLHGHQDFRRLGFEVRIATDDGSIGRKGYVTSLVQSLFEKEPAMRKAHIYACGPRPMFQALERVLRRHGCDAYFSLDENMACGVGVCLGCAVRTAQNAQEPFRLVCRHGPVFKMSEIEWNAS